MLIAARKFFADEEEDNKAVLDQFREKTGTLNL